jgi:hypothetical protein
MKTKTNGAQSKVGFFECNVVIDEKARSGEFGFMKNNIHGQDLNAQMIEIE